MGREEGNTDQEWAVGLFQAGLPLHPTPASQQRTGNRSERQPEFSVLREMVGREGNRIG